MRFNHFVLPWRKFCGPDRSECMRNGKLKVSCGGCGRFFKACAPEEQKYPPRNSVPRGIPIIQTLKTLVVLTRTMRNTSSHSLIISCVIAALFPSAYPAHRAFDLLHAFHGVQGDVSVCNRSCFLPHRCGSLRRAITTIGIRLRPGLRPDEKFIAAGLNTGDTTCASLKLRQLSCSLFL